MDFALPEEFGGGDMGGFGGPLVEGVSELWIGSPLTDEETVAYLGAADNSRGPLLSRLKGAHQLVIKPRQPVFSFSEFIPIKC